MLGPCWITSPTGSPFSVLRSPSNMTHNGGVESIGTQRLQGRTLHDPNGWESHMISVIDCSRQVLFPPLLSGQGTPHVLFEVLAMTSAALPMSRLAHRTQTNNKNKKRCRFIASDPGVLGPLGVLWSWVLGSWGPGVLGSWGPGIMGPGVLGSWGPGVLGSCGHGVLGSWGLGPELFQRFHGKRRALKLRSISQ
jgi:hypothetical protein